MDKQDEQDMRRLLAPSPLCPLCSLWLILSLLATSVIFARGNSKFAEGFQRVLVSLCSDSIIPSSKGFHSHPFQQSARLGKLIQVKVLVPLLFPTGCGLH